jgi:hypothetical protein
VEKDRLLCASDYNHSDSKFPHSVEAVTPLFPSPFGSEPVLSGVEGARVREKRRLVSKKILAIALATLTLVSVHLAKAQQARKVYRIGYLSALSPSAESSRLDGFQQGLRDLGYADEKKRCD